MYNHWRDEIRIKLALELQDLQKRHESKRNEINDIYNENRRKILADTQIIGITTSGAAKNQALIRSVGSRICIVEEAGEYVTRIVNLVLHY